MSLALKHGTSLVALAMEKERCTIAPIVESVAPRNANACEFNGVERIICMRACVAWLGLVVCVRADVQCMPRFRANSSTDDVRLRQFYFTVPTNKK